MKMLVRLVSIPVFIGVLFCYRGTAFAEHTGPGQYNDEDLKKYETPNRAAEKTAPAVSDKISNVSGEKKSKGIETTQGREDWCRRGTPVLSAISEAKKELEEIDKFSDYEAMGNEAKQEKRNSIMKRLGEAESALDDLDNEAHAKGAPPGWIRCNFE